MRATLDKRLHLIFGSASLQLIFSGGGVRRQSLRLPATQAAFETYASLTFYSLLH